MDREECLSLARRWAHDAVARGRVEVFDELLATTVVDHSGPSPATGVEPFKTRTRAIHAAFRDVVVAVEQLLVEGDTMAWRWKLTAIHAGPFLGLAATGRAVSMTGMNFQRVAGGRIIEHWSNADQLGLVHQLR